MAYGMRSRSRRSSMRGAKRRLSYGRKVPVPKKRRTTRTYTRNNSYAINTLARDVRYLKRARYGSVQKNLQVLPPGRPLTPTSRQPVLCCINNIQADNPLSGSTGAPWYQVNSAGSLTEVSRFTRNDQTYFEQQNDDIIDGGVALLGAIKLTFRIDCIPDNGNQISNKRIRIDMFKQRSNALVSPPNVGDLQQLPAVAAINKLQNMANPTLNK